MGVRLVVLLSIVVASFAVQNSDSLLLRARASADHKAGRDIDILQPVATLESLAADCTLIVRGVIRSLKTRLSADEALVVTEYELVPLQFYKGALAPPQRPGTTKPLLMATPGGVLDVDGLHLWSRVGSFPEREPLNVGENVIVFLGPEATDADRLWIQGQAFGAFRVAEGIVTASTSDVVARRKDRAVSLTAFEARLRTLMLK